MQYLESDGRDAKGNVFPSSVRITAAAQLCKTDGNAHPLIHQLPLVVFKTMMFVM